MHPTRRFYFSGIKIVKEFALFSGGGVYFQIAIRTSRFLIE